MRNVILTLIVLSALCFVLAVVLVLFSGGNLMGVAVEGYSRACSNLALIAIALLLFSEKKGSNI